MLKRKPKATVSQDEISTMIGDIASLQRSRDKALQMGQAEETQLINSNLLTANKVLAIMLDERIGK